MKIIKPSVEWEQKPPKDALKIIERAARKCHQSKDAICPGSDEVMVKKLLRMGHDSVLEHIILSVCVVCDRGVSHEFVRHRIGQSYSQESTRYCRYKDGIMVILPPGLTTILYDSWHRAVRAAEREYDFLLDHGVSPQIARSVLPTCLKTEFVVTGNIRSWRTFFKQRLAPAAHPQMREIAGMILKMYLKAIPIVFDEFETVWEVCRRV